MQKALTDTFLKGLKAPVTGRVEIADAKCSGLVYRLTAAGVGSFAFRYRTPATRKTTRFTLGTYPKPVTLKAARKRADELREQVGAGKDPGAARRDARASAETKTFAHLAGRYMREHARRFKRSHANDDRNLRLHILPRWRSRSFASITRSDAIELLEGVIADGKLTLANRLQSLISKIFNWAIDADEMTVNPIAGMRRRGVENVGRRVLSDGEIRVFWRAIVEPPVSEQTGQALRLALLTGTRIAEVAGLCRAELGNVQDVSAAVWIIDSSRTKNGLPHAIPLGPMARGIVLDRLGQLGRDDRFLFPARSRPGEPMKSSSLSNGMLRLAETVNGGDDAARTWKAEPPSPHDLRRTFATRMAALGIPQELRDRLMNHAPNKGDVGRLHYNHHDFLAEKRVALVAWDAALDAILREQPANVVPISKGRRR